MKRGMICFVIAWILFSHQKEDIKTYTACFRYHDKVYTFDLKVIDEQYISMNDMYPMIVVLDKQMHMFSNHVYKRIIYTNETSRYIFDYNYKKIIENSEVIDVSLDKLYFVDENIYFPKKYIENVLLKGKMKINFKNKNAIIQ